MGQAEFEFDGKNGIPSMMQQNGLQIVWWITETKIGLKRTPLSSFQISPGCGEVFAELLSPGTFS
jgi:hypothetical protein